MASPVHPRDVLHGAQAGAVFLPACDHYCGVEPRISKSLALQSQTTALHGACVMDVTLDCEDGAPVGAEFEHANMLLASIFKHFDAIKNAANAIQPRVAVRVHPVGHPAFLSDVANLVGPSAAHLCHVMLPKVEHVDEVNHAVAAIDEAAPHAQLAVHALIESPLAVHRAFDIAAHPRIQSLSFGLMDFVSAHNGALDERAMTAQGQFTDPQVLRAKLAVAAACHAHGKVPSHCVVTEFADVTAMEQAAAQARALGYTRMWSIHPAQVRPILAAFAPKRQQISQAAALLMAAQAAQWAPIRFNDQLHDRASYRLYWDVLQRAHQTGASIPETVAGWFVQG